MNKLAIVTGGTKGIGRAIAEQFAAEGFDLVVSARTENDLKELQNALQNAYAVRCYGIRADMSVRPDVEAMAAAVRAMQRPVDVLVHNAGLFRAGQLINEPDDTLEALMAVNLYGSYYLTKGLLPQLTQQGFGHIFHVCSIASIYAPPNCGSYTLTKFAQLGFAKVLREELKPYNVRVTAVLPGATLTASWDGISLLPDRLMPPEDVAAAVWSAFAMKNSVVEEVIIQPPLGAL